jgi:DNA-binding helix-hairpin-helix protein with protein kinase domain
VNAARDVLLASEPPRTLRLSERPIGRGGQAVVYAAEADPRLAVKLYHEPAADVERRLDGMLRLARPEEFLTRDSAAHPELAWPSALVRDVDRHHVIGYAMRRVGQPDFFPLGVLFSNPHRRQTMEEMSWRFLVGVSRNLACLAAALHERDFVLGDVSHANVVVSRHGYLTFLDCDSMQFVAPHSGERFPCLVMTAEYAAPELLSNGHVDRTPVSDTFSLALLVCRLLLVGDHPFMGVRKSALADDESGTADNIREGYSYLVRPEEMGVPREHIKPSLLPPALLGLAVRAFGEGHSNPAARPSAAEWLAALDDVQASLTVCRAERLHVFSGHLASCPWCARVADGAWDPFAPARRSAPAHSPRPVTGTPAGGSQLSPAFASVLFGILAVIAIVVLLAVLL